MQGLGLSARIIRVAVALAMAATTAACFQPLYGERTLTGGPGIATLLAGVDVQNIDVPNGTPEARIATQLRNDLIFGVSGGGERAPFTHSLKIRMTTTRLSVIVDRTARPDVENFGLNISYELTDIRTGKPAVVVRDQTFARVSYDIPGQEQRFARERALRDAEDRAAQVISDNIKSRLASYFVAGT